MKKKVIAILICFAAFVAAGDLFAQSTAVTDSMKVYGNCDMCKGKIEGALKKKDGVISKRWDKETKILTVTYDPSKTDLKKIGEKIANAGYDNEYATATDDAYNTLHNCCKYDRKKEK